jgi:hypothetical protein
MPLIPAWWGGGRTPNLAPLSHLGYVLGQPGELQVKRRGDCGGQLAACSRNSELMTGEVRHLQVVLAQEAGGREPSASCLKYRIILPPQLSIFPSHCVAKSAEHRAFYTFCEQEASWSASSYKGRKMWCSSITCDLAS